MKLFINSVMKLIYLFSTVAWNYGKKIGFPVCKKENLTCPQAHRKRVKNARVSPTPHHTLNEERSARFTAQRSSALCNTVQWWGGKCEKYHVGPKICSRCKWKNIRILHLVRTHIKVPLSLLKPDMSSLVVSGSCSCFMLVSGSLAALFVV